MSHSFFLGLGTNQGDRKKNLELALEELKKHFTLIKVSSVFETKAWGKTDQPDFLNMVVKGQTESSPEEVLQTALDIEIILGRVRLEKWGPRVIDIDLLFYEEEERESDFLKLPHPLLFEREFVLVPLLEIEPEFAWKGIPLKEYLQKLKAEA